MVFDHVDGSYPHDTEKVQFQKHSFVLVFNVFDCQVGVISDRCKLSGWVQPVLWDAHSL